MFPLVYTANNILATNEEIVLAIDDVGKKKTTGRQTATWIKFGIAIILYSVYENMTNSSVIGVVP